MMRFSLCFALVLAVSGGARAQVPPGPPRPPGVPGAPFGPPGLPPGVPPESEAGGEASGGRGESGRISVSIVGGRLVAHCEVSTVHRRLPINVWIDLENPCGLQLHNSAAGALRAENEAGESIPITVRFPDLSMRVERREQGPEEDWSEFTRLWSKEIREDALSGTIGAKVLRDYRVTLDLAEGRIELQKSSSASEAPDGAAGERPADAGRPREEGVVEVALSATDDVLWIPAQFPSGKVVAMALGTSSEDTIVDGAWVDELGFPAGDLDRLRVGSIDLAKLVALRPGEVRFVHPEGAFGVIGLRLLERLRVEIDREQGIARLSVTGSGEFPEADREFFRALVEDEPEPLAEFLEAHPNSRLSQEAARRLLSFRIDERAEGKEVERAVRWLRGTWRDDIVTTRALDLARELRAAGLAESAVLCGRLGIEEGRKDRYPDAVHRTHALLGEILLERNEDHEAWRHLLSAAFGLPEEGRVHLHLGEFYERQGRLGRALSRYVQAVISADSGEKAIEGIDRVERQLGDAKRISVDRVEQLIAGKTYGYTAPTRYRPDPGSPPNRTVLLESFTNGHVKHPTRDEGAIGGALGFEGAISYFPPERLAAITYHLPHPRFGVDSLTNEVSRTHADLLGAQPGVQIVDGARRVPGFAKAREAEAVYKALRSAVIASLREPARHEIRIDARLVARDEDTVLEGTVRVGGPTLILSNVHVLLAERGVLYPSRGKIVIHRMVARAALTAGTAGELYFPLGGSMEIPFRRSLSEVEKDNVRYLEALESSGAGEVRAFAARMDPRQLSIIAFLRDPVSGRTLQAARMDLPSEESAP